MASIARRIRTVSKTDRDQWLQLWQGYLEFYQSELDQTLTDLLWQRILDPNHHIQARVAVREDDGSLLGLAHFFPHAHTWYDHDVCYLNDLFVSPQIRGSGIGQDLIDAVVDESRRRGWAAGQGWSRVHRVAIDLVGLAGEITATINETLPVLTEGIEALVATQSMLVL